MAVRHIGFAAAMLAGACVAACSSTLVGPPSEEELREPRYLEVKTWLTGARGNDAMDALFALLRVRDPDILFVSPESQRSETAIGLQERLAEGVPPDSFQAIGGADIGGYIREGVLAPLDTTAAAEEWATVLPR